jgi:hypothetical protein
MLLVAVFLLSLLVLSLAVAAPKVAKSLQRDRDLETFHRGMQYRRAVQLYYRKFHAYPPNVDALVNTNNIRFLRKKYSDPVTGKDDWKPVLFGQNKTPTAMGFFGQPLSGGATSIAGIGPSGGNGMPGTTNPSGSSFGGSSSFGTNSPGGGSIFGSSSSGDTGSNGTSSSSSSGGSTGSTDNSGGTGSTSATGAAGSTSSTSSSTPGSGTNSGPSGQTFGGAGIIGFSPGSPKQSILVYKKKNHYNEWEFTYDPLSEMQAMPGGNTGTIGQPASSTSNPVGSSPFGNSSFGSSSFGNSGIGGSGSTGPGNNPTPVSSPPSSTQ